MPRRRLSDEQMTIALSQAEAGTPVGEICRKTGVAEATFYRPKRVPAGHSALKVNSAELLALLWANKAC